MDRNITLWLHDEVSIDGSTGSAAASDRSRPLPSRPGFSEYEGENVTYDLAGMCEVHAMSCILV